MSDKQTARKRDWIRQGNRKAVALIVGAVMTVGTIAGVQAFSGSDTYRHMQVASGWHGHKGFSNLSDTEIQDRIERAVKHAAIEIDATPEQQEKIIARVTATAKELKPVHARMHAAKQEIRMLLLAPEIDRAALEELRAARLADAEKVSQDLVDTVADIAELLSPEQRKTLDERIKEFRGMGRRWHRG